MDIDQWKHLLFDWIKASELIDVFGTLEHINLDDYFNKFHCKIHTNTSGNFPGISEFLKNTYPDFEILYDETNNISSQEYVYIFSLLLYYSCIQEKNEYFQNACTKLNSKTQLFLAKFFEFINQQTSFTKEVIRSAIKQAILLSPQSTMHFSANTPTRMSRKSDISPPTPNKDFINSKLKELKLVKSQLENERFEKNMLEAEIKQCQDKIDNLIVKCKDLNHENLSLKSSMHAESESESLSPNKSQREYLIRRKMQREIQNREDAITDLKCELENANSISKKYQGKISVMEKQMNEMRLKILEMDASIDELHCNINLRDKKIINMEEENNKLLEMIHETMNNSRHGKYSSSDCLDFSNSTSLYMTSCSEYEESLAKSVVDVQLKEKDSIIKEKENKIIEKDNTISQLNEKVSSAKKVQEELELKISDMTELIKNFENQLSEAKISNTKLFEEKSTETQLLQNQLNNAVLKNKEYQRDLDLKQKINLQMLKENDSYKLKVENLQQNLTELKCREQEFAKIQEELKQSVQKQQEKFKQQLTLSISKISFNDSTTSLHDVIQKFYENIDIKLKTKSDKIVELTNIVDQIKKDVKMFKKESEEKLILKTNELSSLHIKYFDLERKFIREEMFNNEINKNNDILRAKLAKSREEMTEMNSKHEQIIEKMMKEKRDYHREMEEKLNGYKADILEKYNQTITEAKNKEENKLMHLELENNSLKKKNVEKDDTIRKLNLCSVKLENENARFIQEADGKERTIKNLTLDLEHIKRENEFLLSKLRFLENSENNNYDISDSKSHTSDIFGEKFDNEHLNSLKNGTSFDDRSCMMPSSLLQQRNSQYPQHLRDSYAIRELDQDLSEYDIKFGRTSSIPESIPSSAEKNEKRRKYRVAYNKPGPPTPSKHGRLSNNSYLNVLKDTTNIENTEKKSSPNLVKSLIMQFSRPKKDDSHGIHHDKKSYRKSKRFRNLKDDYRIIEMDETDSDENVNKCSRKVKEIDRREKRDKARDLNRPNFNENHIDTTICSSDSDWIDEIENSIDDEKSFERMSNASKKLDQSLEYIKIRENHRKLQHIKRRRSFSNNRRSSFLRNHNKISRTLTDDWDKYKSCMSLRSESSFALNQLLTPIKSCSRNFVNMHFDEYDRISDYHVQQRRLSNEFLDEDSFWNTILKDIKKPCPLVVIILFTIMLMANLLYKYNN